MADKLDSTTHTGVLQKAQTINTTPTFEHMSMHPALMRNPLQLRAAEVFAYEW